MHSKPYPIGHYRFWLVPSRFIADDIMGVEACLGRAGEVIESESSGECESRFVAAVAAEEETYFWGGAGAGEGGIGGRGRGDVGNIEGGVVI